MIEPIVDGIVHAAQPTLLQFRRNRGFRMKKAPIPHRKDPDPLQPAESVLRYNAKRISRIAGDLGQANRADNQADHATGQTRGKLAVSADHQKSQNDKRNCCRSQRT